MEGVREKSNSKREGQIILTLHNRDHQCVDREERNASIPTSPKDSDLRFKASVYYLLSFSNNHTHVRVGEINHDLHVNWVKIGG